MRTFNQKLRNIQAGKYTPQDFIIADAKDGDSVATASGPDATGRMKPRSVHFDAIREISASGFVDIMLMQASACERLSEEGFFKNSSVTPAIRLNDETYTWGSRGGRYFEQHSRHYRTARVEQCKKYVDLGLYSVTFSNERDLDALNGEMYSLFRAEAAHHGMRHFLEIFNPDTDLRLAGGAEIGSYINDQVIRLLAGVMAAERPLFLKLQYNGPRAMEELAAWDPGHLIVGVLGGPSGTNRDTFELLAQAQKYGARIALFGRKIHFAESPIDVVALMRQVADGQLTSSDATKAYHGALQRKNIQPVRTLVDDLEVTDPSLKQDVTI